MLPKQYYILFTFLILILNCNADSDDDVIKSCEKQKTCSSCLQTPTCMWCSVADSGINNHEPFHCMPRNDIRCDTCACNFGSSDPRSCGCEDTCFPPGENNTKICSGHGTCDCGKCRCDNNVIYSGPYCQDCSTCSEDHCSKLKDCVECYAYRTGPHAKNRMCHGCSSDIIVEVLANNVTVDSAGYEVGIRLCYVPTDDGCSFNFTYQIENRRSHVPITYVAAEGVRQCPVPPIPNYNIVIFTIILIIAILIFGILILLIRKTVKTAHDQQEVAKFEKEVAVTKWQQGDNPIFKQATTIFENPTFEQSTINEIS